MKSKVKTAVAAIRALAAVTLWLSGAACWLKGDLGGGCACYGLASVLSVWAMMSE